MHPATEDPISIQDLMWVPSSWSITVEGSTVSPGRRSFIRTRHDQPPVELKVYAPFPPMDPSLRYAIHTDQAVAAVFRPLDTAPIASSPKIETIFGGAFMMVRLSGYGLLLVDASHGADFDPDTLSGVVDAIDGNAPEAAGTGIVIGAKGCDRPGIEASPGTTIDLSLGIIRNDGVFLGWEQRSFEIPIYEEPSCSCTSAHRHER